MSKKRRRGHSSNALTMKAVPRTRKMGAWTLPMILSLLVSAVGAVGIIELRPQLAVSAQQEIQKSDPFSAPFRIDNSGYLSFYVDHVFVYVGEAKIGGATFGRDLYHQPDWEKFELGRGESRTILINLVRVSGVPHSADIAIVVDVRPFHWFPWSFRRYFRFTGAYIDNWQWLAQPSGPIREDADGSIDKFIPNIPESR